MYTFPRGRPKSPSAKKMFSFHCSTESIEIMKQIAFREAQPLAKICREAFDRYIADYNIKNQIKDHIKSSDAISQNSQNVGVSGQNVQKWRTMSPSDPMRDNWYLRENGLAAYQAWVRAGKPL